MADHMKNTKGAADKTDKHVGRRLRLRRTSMGVYQKKMADMLGVTFQQVQKYEQGINRISAGRLWEISQILEVSVDYFYEGIEGNNYTSPSYSKQQIKMIQLLDQTPLPMQKAVLNVLKAARQ